MVMRIYLAMRIDADIRIIQHMSDIVQYCRIVRKLMWISIPSPSALQCIYRVSQKKRSLRIFTPLGASGDNSVGQGCWGDVG